MKSAFGSGYTFGGGSATGKSPKMNENSAFGTRSAFGSGYTFG